jgi:hypothetical protein
LQLSPLKERRTPQNDLPIPAGEFWHLTQGSVMQKNDSLCCFQSTRKKKRANFFHLSLSLVVTPNRPSTVYGMFFFSKAVAGLAGLEWVYRFFERLACWI